MKVYVVTGDGSCDGYAIKVYLLGVFSTREAAEECVKRNTLKDPVYGIDTILEIHEAELDESYDFKLVDSLNFDPFFENDLFLGGYEE